MTEQNSLAREYSYDTREEDPLEELARIVSGERKPAPKTGEALTRPSFDNFTPTLPPAAETAPDAYGQDDRSGQSAYGASGDAGHDSPGGPAYAAQDDSLEYDLENELLQELESVAHEDAHDEAAAAGRDDDARVGNGERDDGSLEDQLLVELGLSDGESGHSGEFLTGFEDESPIQPADIAEDAQAATADDHVADADDDYENETNAALRESLGLAGDFKDKFEAEMAINRAAEALNMDARRYDSDDALDDIEFDPSIWGSDETSGDTEITLEQLMEPPAPAAKPAQPARAAQAPREAAPAPRQAAQRAPSPQQAVATDREPVQDEAAQMRRQPARPEPEPARQARYDHDATEHAAPEYSRAGRAAAPHAQAPQAQAPQAQAPRQHAHADDGRALAPVAQPAAPAMMFNSEREIDEHFAAVFAEELGFDDQAPAPVPALRKPGASAHAPAPAAPPARAAEYAAPVHEQASWEDAPYDEADPQDDYADEYDDAYEDAYEDTYEETYEDDYGEHYPQEQPVARASGSRGFRLAGIALGLALVVGLGAVSYGFFKGGSTPSEPVLVRAEQDPVKTRPEDPGGTAVANQDNAAYERVSGNFGGEAKQEKLVSDVEEPVNLATSAPQASAAAGSTLSQTDDLAAKGDERLAPGEQTAAVSPTTLQPRVVRTLTVRRDGTIVRSGEAAAPAAADPVSIDGARTTGSVPVPLPRPDASSAAAAAPLPATLPSTAPPPVAGNPLPGVSVGQTVVPVPSTDPVTTQSVVAVDEPAAPVALAPAPQAQPAAAAATEQAAFGEWVVQISSQRSPEDAQASYRNLLNRFPNILEGRRMAIREADIPDRGVFYRVHIAAQSKEDATGFCQQLQSAGGACFVTR